jgi:hypothetical protein
MLLDPRHEFTNCDAISIPNPMLEARHNTEDLGAKPAAQPNSSTRPGLPTLSPEAQSAITQIVYFWRLRQRWHRAEKALVLQGKALCRALADGDKDVGSKLYDSVEDGTCLDEATVLAVIPFVEAQRRLETDRLALEKNLAKLARKLPAYEFVKNARGVGDLSYAAIVGEAGDISSYRTVSGLWKRMGLAVIQGERQRRVTNAELALEHGYSPARRSVMWNVGGGLIRGMGRGLRPQVGQDLSTVEGIEWTVWAKLFVERCRFECARDPVKFPMKTAEKNGVEVESYPKHAQNRAKRYVEKRFLRKLFAEWRLEVFGASDDPDDA